VAAVGRAEGRLERGVVVMVMAAECARDVHTNVHINVHTARISCPDGGQTTKAIPRDIPGRRVGHCPCGHSCGHRRKKNLVPGRTGAVKAGEAEGDTCGPRALRAPDTPHEDTLDVAGPSGPAWMRLVRSLPESSVTPE
jgi:hypothetical protein